MKVIGAALSAAVLTCGVVSAEEIAGSQFGYGNWSGAAYTYDQTGEFSHCAVSAGFVSGDTLLFSVNKQGTVSVGVANNALNFPVGDSFPVSIYVDRRQPIYGTATAMDRHFAALEIPEFDRALETFKRGYTMTIEAAGRRGVYDLTGTFRALEQAKACAYNYYRHAGAPSPDSGSDVDKTVLFQVAGEVISELGVKGARYLTENELEAQGWGTGMVYWQAEAYGMSGAVLVVENNTVDSLRETDSVDSQFIADRCNGDFASSARQVSNSETEIRELRLVCSKGESINETYLTKTGFGDKVLYVMLEFDSSETPERSGERSTQTEAATLRAASFVLDQ